MDRYFEKEWDKAYVRAYEAVYDFTVISGTARRGYLTSMLPRQPHDITLVTQCSVDRLARLEEQGKERKFG